MYQSVSELRGREGAQDNPPPPIFHCLNLYLQTFTKITALNLKIMSEYFQTQGTADAGILIKTQSAGGSGSISGRYG